jgi:hypothetical protein
MRTGRPPLPTKVKLLRGTLRQHRRNPAEPMPSPGAPSRPATLPVQARPAWRWLVRLLTSMRVITKADGPVLVLAACRLGDYLELRRDVDTHGLTYKTTTTTGSTMYRQRPEVPSAPRRRTISWGDVRFAPSCPVPVVFAGILSEARQFTIGGLEPPTPCGEFSRTEAKRSGTVTFTSPIFDVWGKRQGKNDAIARSMSADLSNRKGARSLKRHVLTARTLLPFRCHFAVRKWPFLSCAVSISKRRNRREHVKVQEFGGDPGGIRTRDLDLERVASWARLDDGVNDRSSVYPSYGCTLRFGCRSQK